MHCIIVNEKSYRMQNGRDLDLKPRLATSLNVKIDVRCFGYLSS
jgi:hypothetical protein